MFLPTYQEKVSSKVFPFDLSSWRAVDDRVRGGSSVSHLEALSHHHHSQGVRFFGNLDTSTLGGAGFASQSYTFGEDSPLSYPSSKYAGLALTLLLPPTSDSEKGGHQSTSTTISPRLPTTLTITFKTEEAERRPDGRMESGINWEAHVDTRDLSATTTIANASEESLRTVNIPFHSLVPTFRGRPLPSPPEKPFDSNHITSISLMCRSNFDEQAGDFSFKVASLVPVERNGSGWCSWLYALLRSFFGRGG